MGKDLMQYSLFICWAVVMWFYGRLWHQTKNNRPRVPVYLVCAPDWLIWLCGKPRSDGRLELGAIVFQLAMILDLLLLPMFLAFSVEYRLRGHLFLFAWAVPIGLNGLGRLTACVWQKFRS